MTEFYCALCGLAPCACLKQTKSFASVGYIAFGRQLWERGPTAGAPDVPAPDPAPRPAPERLTGKVIGYRAWTLDGYRLVSANNVQHGAHWNIGPNRAECLIDKRIAFLGGRDPRRGPVERHDAPHPDCECGLYAYYKPGQTSNHFDPTGRLWGAVLAWGRVEAHSDGFRAEYAEPIVLAYRPRDAYEDVMRWQAVAGELGLPIVPFDELPAEAAKHGQEVPESMRPARQSPYLHEMSGSFEHSIYPVFETFTFQAKTLIEAQNRALRAFGSVASASKPKAGSAKKGVKAIRKVPGPPSLGKWQKNDRIRDSRGVTWRCVAPGKPGTWERDS